VGIDIYPLSGFLIDFNKMTKRVPLSELLGELIEMKDPEDHKCAIDCPHIPGVYNVVKFMCNNIILITALDRLNEKTKYEQKIITLYSCSNY